MFSAIKNFLRGTDAEHGLWKCVRCQHLVQEHCRLLAEIEELERGQRIHRNLVHRNRGLHLVEEPLTESEIDEIVEILFPKEDHQ